MSTNGVLQFVECFKIQSILKLQYKAVFIIDIQRVGLWVFPTSQQEYHF